MNLILFEKWSDPEWLVDFFLANMGDLESYFKITDINQAIYEIRQDHFEGKRLPRTYDLCRRLKESENYKFLQANMAQHIIQDFDCTTATFVGMLQANQKKSLDFVTSPPNFLMTSINPII